MLLSAIANGIKAPLTQVPTPNDPKIKPQEVKQIKTTLQESLDAQVIRPLTQEEQKNTKYWVPIFLRPKRDDPKKFRLITNLTALNKCTQTKKFKAESWNSVKELLQDPKLS